MDVMLATLDLPNNRNQGQKIYWWEGQNPSEYNMIRTSGEGGNKRDSKDVPVEEVVNAIRYVLIEQISLSEEDLIREQLLLIVGCECAEKISSIGMRGRPNTVTEKIGNGMRT